MEDYNQKVSAGGSNRQMISGKKKDDAFTEDSSIYVHGDDNTNAANVNSNRHDIQFDGIEQISDDDNSP